MRVAEWWVSWRNHNQIRRLLDRQSVVVYYSSKKKKTSQAHYLHHCFSQVCCFNSALTLFEILQCPAFYVLSKHSLPLVNQFLIEKKVGNSCCLDALLTNLLGSTSSQTLFVVNLTSPSPWPQSEHRQLNCYKGVSCIVVQMCVKIRQPVV